MPALQISISSRSGEDSLRNIFVTVIYAVRVYRYFILSLTFYASSILIICRSPVIFTCCLLCSSALHGLSTCTCKFVFELRQQWPLTIFLVLFEVYVNLIDFANRILCCTAYYDSEWFISCVFYARYHKNPSIKRNLKFHSYR